MTGTTTRETAPEQTARPEPSEQDTVVYVYGIVPADVEAEPDARGVHDSEVRVVRCDDIAALVSKVPRDEALGRPADLTAHAAVLDGTAAAAPVLPMRFGAVVASEEAVTGELLTEHHDEFAAALTELEGKAQYVIRGRYQENVVLREILEENPQLAQLRESLRGKPEDATRNERIALGEHINNAITAKREADTATMTEAIASVLDAPVNVREPTHEEDAVYLAVLVEVARQSDLEELVDRVAEQWRDRVDVELRGPLAPYDFVVTQQGQG
ncbi:GvpL/GvpF family gas vesicle protein [Amycolatopsis rhizosphaerae]|uniref:GvpL/GvpF family gas vesicle protein n=1 Tax=Amycolatopsis rhizosphaerae TaxID=2053003 RepID=A0A558A9K3_9PSEU|nr:GvpL/GvpF family gas vesicle protein [Amycolatopsis rhizosphaerae]TVT20948.1 GvpL/GvpF family gas vesicle protein [Amycolatopsis rhizosphaerae]